MGSEQSDVIVLDDTRVFVEKDWLRKNKVYPFQNTPSYISDARDTAFSIPRDIQLSIPTAATTVFSFLKSKIPPLKYSIIVPKSEEWFSDETPITPLTKLYDRPLPPRKTITQLLAISGQQWFDGRRSIRDPRYADKKERLPLSALSWWDAALTARSAFDSWKEGHRWTTTHTFEYSLDRALQEDVKMLFTQLGWSTVVRYKASEVSGESLQFSRLLCSGPDINKRGWLSDMLIDLMVVILNERLVSARKEGVSVERCFIGDSRVADGLSRAVNISDFDSRKRNSYLHEISDAVQKGDITSLYFPVNCGGCHWVVVYVDFENCSIHVGKLYFLP